MKKILLTIAAVILFAGIVLAERNRVVNLNDIGGGKAIDTLALDKFQLPQIVPEQSPSFLRWLCANGRLFLIGR